MKKLKRKLHWYIWGVAYRLQRRLYPHRHEIGKIYENGVEITSTSSANHSTFENSPSTRQGQIP